jgi:hypothetical protein
MSLLSVMLLITYRPSLELGVGARIAFSFYRRGRTVPVQVRPGCVTELGISVKPTVLIATTSQWFSTARLAMALADAGCVVDAVCPPQHPLRTTSLVRQIHAYHGLRPVHSFAEAISASKPDLIVPGDDLSTQHLHKLYQRACRNPKAKSPVCAVIERSLGAPESFPVVYARTTVLELAKAEGVRVPKTAVIANLVDLRNWVDRVGLPTVLKADGTSGGEGVRVVCTMDEAEKALRRLQAPPMVAKALKWALVDQDMTLVLPTLLRRRSVVNAQVFVEGREATSLVACWKGTVLAGLHFEVLNKQNAAGPATVMRLVENPEMQAAAEKMVRRLNLSGLHGFDFMLEAGTENAYLIEINPRATQVGHLTLGPGRDLPAALHAAVSGKAYQAAPKLTEKDTIALFPGEWLRNPESTFLRSAYHDVPWREPGLVRACVRKPRKWSGWYLQEKWMRVSSGAMLPRL